MAAAQDPVYPRVSRHCGGSPAPTVSKFTGKDKKQGTPTPFPRFTDTITGWRCRRAHQNQKEIDVHESEGNNLMSSHAYGGYKMVFCQD